MPNGNGAGIGCFPSRIGGTTRQTVAHLEPAALQTFCSLVNRWFTQP